MEMEHMPAAMLLMVPGIGSLKQRKLTDYFGDAETAWNATGEELNNSHILNGREIEAILSLLDRLDRELIADRDRIDRQRSEDRKADGDRLDRIETDIRSMRDMLFDAFQRGRSD